MNFKFFKWALGVLGFSTVATSCELIDDIGGGGMVCMYGCPSADYVFNVDVADKESNEPIEGIRVSVLNRGVAEYWNSETGTTEPKPYCDTLAVGTTGADGKLLINYNGFPAASHELAFDDVDGQENGGLYASASTTLNHESDDYKNPGENGWYSGTATHKVSVKLEKKEE